MRDKFHVLDRMCRLHFSHSDDVLPSHKSFAIGVELNHFLQVFPDIWEASQRLLHVLTGQREAAAVVQGFYRGQMFAFGQYARLCQTHTHTNTNRGNHK